MKIVLVGGGHAHALVMKSFMRAPFEVAPMLISDCAETPYSGMIPGHIAGHYSYDEVHIDLANLAQKVGVSFCRDEVVGLDLTHKKVLCKDRPPVGYDLLSINIGSRTQLPNSFKADFGLRPISGLLSSWEGILKDPREGLIIGIVGAGAAGIEVAMAMRHRLGSTCKIIVLEAAGEILPGHPPHQKKSMLRVCKKMQVDVRISSSIVSRDGNMVRLSTGESLQVDYLFAATGASSFSWIEESGLAVDENGFIKVDSYLRSISHPEVFAVGDIASLGTSPPPKAGVYSVRQAPILANNLHATTGRGSLSKYRAQKSYLSLLSCGSQRAVAARGSLRMSGKYVWKLKDRIDRGFMSQFDLRMSESKDNPMHCLGCAAKASPQILSQALGAGSNEDAVRIELGKDSLWMSTDIISALVSDPYLFGQIVAVHCLNDIYAMGQLPKFALANVLLDEKDEFAVDTLKALSAGLRSVLKADDVDLLGGHTGRADKLYAGLSVAAVESSIVWQNSKAVEGDVLILTKPLGVGLLFAGQMRGLCRSRFIDAALEQMKRSHRSLVDRNLPVRAATDVSGFGLAGHLVEMLQCTNLCAYLDETSLPRYEGCDGLLEQGVASSVIPSLLAAYGERLWFRDLRSANLLLDPQTAGGILLAVERSDVEHVVESLVGMGFVSASPIGEFRKREGESFVRM